MEIQSLEQLQAADRTSLAFTPHGLGRMEPGDAARFQQSQIASCKLSTDVPERTRGAFEELTKLFAQGVLCYSVYTRVQDDAMLRLEGALRDRFVQWCGGSVTFEDVAGALPPYSADVTTPQAVSDACKGLPRGSRGRSPKWRLRVGGQLIFFDGMLSSLMRWARCAGLLRGQRARHVEFRLVKRRNSVAHGDSHIDTPVAAARALRDLAEFINQLWGHPTPGGRLYPAQVPREVAVLAWDGAGSISLGSPESVAAGEDTEGYSHVVVRSASAPGMVVEDSHWMEFDARFETTQYPTEHLWGPVSRSEALAWLDAERPQGDSVEFLDRVFMVRSTGGQVYPPMRPEVAAGLDSALRQGAWHTVRADFPLDAFNHVRGGMDPSSEHSKRPGDCPACAVQELGRGSHTAALGVAEAALGTLTPVRPPTVHVPESLHWPIRF
ncbi:hypothetical protein [Streptomyces collinus]|uniref:hypothetical protein n=1 Tax=Streptomyces collinus TaxID=42684 RepID=UPI002941BA82|nr:hypothetical protein [Streptomyces collinus]